MFIFDSQTLQLTERIKGTDSKRAIGKKVKIQKEPFLNGNRIWYSTENKVFAASYVTYGQSTPVLDDEIYVKDLSNVYTDLGLFEDSIIFGSEKDGFINFFELKACPSGTEYNETVADQVSTHECKPC